MLLKAALELATVVTRLVIELPPLLLLLLLPLSAKSPGCVAHGRFTPFSAFETGAVVRIFDKLPLPRPSKPSKSGSEERPDDAKAALCDESEAGWLTK